MSTEAPEAQYEEEESSASTTTPTALGGITSGASSRVSIDSMVTADGSAESRGVMGTELPSGEVWGKSWEPVSLSDFDSEDFESEDFESEDVKKTLVTLHAELPPPLGPPAAAELLGTLLLLAPGPCLLAMQQLLPAPWVISALTTTVAVVPPAVAPSESVITSPAMSDPLVAPSCEVNPSELVIARPATSDMLVDGDLVLP